MLSHDVIIAGGGISGLYCAWKLAETGQQVIDDLWSLCMNKFSFLDLLYDYGSFLEAADIKLGCIPKNTENLRIGIIGAGISGLIAAYELLRAGAKNIVLIEAEKNRIGGRAFTKIFDEEKPQFIAEMGAMRFPSSGIATAHYFKKFGIDTTEAFPDPGIVDTEIYYRGRSYFWKANTAPPSIFSKVFHGWHAFLNDGVVLGNNKLIAPRYLTKLLSEGNYNEAQLAWQKYLDIFSDFSFYTGLITIFTGSFPPGGIRWEKPDDFHIFGSLGIGTGGFQPLYNISFTEIMRIIINALDVDQRIIRAGISSFVNSIASTSFHEKTIRDRLVIGKIIGLQRDDQGSICATMSDSTIERFDRVIVTSTNRSMQVNLKLTHGKEWFNESIRRAINETHLIGSSKIFILTKSKFWIKNKFAQNIQTDTLVKSLYCLDYEPTNPESWGVVLISYTWEDDAHKMLSFSGKEARCKRLVQDIAVLNPKFASYLRPLNDNYEKYVQEYDWISDENALGAFKLNYPGDDIYSRDLFFQFKSVNSPAENCGIYLAGCGASFTGGWAEGGIQTAINCACAVIKSCGGVLHPGNPLDAMNCQYEYCVSDQEAISGR